MSFLDNLHLSDQPKQGELEISVFGRGFGECIVIGCGNGDYAVIDSFQNAETKRPIALDYLEKIGVDPKTAIKEVIITHWHSDHIGMMSELIKTANNSQIIINPVFSNRNYSIIPTRWRDYRKIFAISNGIKRQNKKRISDR